MEHMMQQNRTIILEYQWTSETRAPSNFTQNERQLFYFSVLYLFLDDCLHYYPVLSYGT